MKLKENSKSIMVSGILLCLSAVGILFSAIRISTYFICSVFNIVSAVLIGYTAYGILKNESIVKVLQRFILSIISFPAVGVFIKIISVFIFNESIYLVDIVMLIPSILIMYVPIIIFINEMIKNDRPNKFVIGFSILISIFTIISVFAKIIMGSITYANGIQVISAGSLFYIGLLAYSVGIESDGNVEQQKAEKVVIEESNIAKMVILSIITLGIYTYVWIYNIAKKIKELNGENLSVSGEIICCIFVPFYFLYWVYTRYAKLIAVANKNNINIGDNGVLYLILSFVGLGIVTIALMQNDLNIMARSMKDKNVNSASPQLLDMSDVLKKLSELYIQGVLSDEEYEIKVRELKNKSCTDIDSQNNI